MRVVHFNRLKLCSPGTRFDIPVSPDSVEDSQHPSPGNDPDSFGQNMELLEYGPDDNTGTPTPVVPPATPQPTSPRYPHRARARPDFNGTYVDY